MGAMYRLARRETCRAGYNPTGGRASQSTTTAPRTWYDQDVFSTASRTSYETITCFSFPLARQHHMGRGPTSEDGRDHRVPVYDPAKSYVSMEMLLASHSC